jgi:5'-nucleotidase
LIHIRVVHHERDISVHRTHPEDSELLRLLADVEARVTAVSNIPLFKTTCSLDGRSLRIRNYETNLGNLLADVIRAYYDTDIAFVNSGSVRCDRIIPDGVLTVRDVVGKSYTISPVNLTLRCIRRHTTVRQCLRC